MNCLNASRLGGAQQGIISSVSGWVCGGSEVGLREGVRRTITPAG